ncbi:IclR family transcriptional regulator [Tomitella biformata]|uniref:IclR family transcriptional regulator n=1 Tax=Tomitella biformata TaxID=630403 RepID=UPI00046353EA|nr:IclR family transcriptional regulator [Tomitella biformata]
MTEPAQDAQSTLDRVDLIFDALEEHGFLTLSEVVRITDIPRSTAHRLLSRMVQKRWLLRVGTRYELGVRIFELGSEGVRNHWFHRIAYPRLNELQLRTGYVVHMAYLDGADAVYWERIGSSPFGSALTTRIGARRPAHRTALGKVLLAAEPPELLDSAAFANLKPGTPLTVTDRDALRVEIARVRAEGIAYDRGESLVGIGCIAAPVLAGRASTSDGHTTTAAISVCAPVDKLHRAIAAAVREVAADITRTAGRNPMAGG